MPEIRLHYTPPKYVCSCCGEEKPATEFYTQSTTGLPTKQCKECINIKRACQRDKRKVSKFVAKERQRACGEEVTYTVDDWKATMVHFKGCCAYCGKPQGRAKADRLDKDHVIAFSKGGKTERHNIVPACKKCNRGRGNREWRTWYKSQDFYDTSREEKIDKWIEPLTYNV
jgi:5-methylcytosine-specific restriction endonuclease McrA